VGQYPPALRPLIDRRVDFAQLEDFNKKSDGNADAYVAQYMARMEGRATAPGGGYSAPEYFEVDDDYEDYDDYDDAADLHTPDLSTYDHITDGSAVTERAQKMAKQQAEEWRRWSNTEDTTRMWALISSDRYDELAAWIDHAPPVVEMRAEDGRGPLWWAYEYDRPDMVDLLIQGGADPTATDSLGMKPREMQT